MDNKWDKSIGRTLILVKPDGIARGLTGEILSRFERKGLSIITAKMERPTAELAGEHYAEHKGSGAFFDAMVNALTCGPNLAVVLEGPLAVKASRQIIGFASPIDQSPIGTIRGDFAIQEPQNLVHGSDSPSAAQREIILWFGEELLLNKPKAKAAPKPKKTPFFKEGEPSDLLPNVTPPMGQGVWMPETGTIDSSGGNTFSFKTWAATDTTALPEPPKAGMLAQAINFTDNYSIDPEDYSLDSDEPF